MDNPPDSVRLATFGRTDRDVAIDLKTRLAEALSPVLDLCREANSLDLDVQLQFSRDQFGILKLEPILLRRY